MALAGAIAVGACAAPAYADTRPVVGACREITDASLMRDTGEPLRLTVRKTQANPYDEGSLPPGSVEGIEFKLFEVQGLSLTTPSGLSQAQKLTLDDARDLGLTQVASGRTGSDGTITFAGLKPAMYVVEEVAPDDDTHDYRTSDPFLILLPTFDADCETTHSDTVTVVKSRAKTPPTVTTVSTTPPNVPPPSWPNWPPETSTVTTTPPTTPVTTTVTGGPPVTTTVPGGPGTPGSPGSPGNPSKPGRPDGPLAYTGANVIWALFVALALIIGGVLLVRRSRDNESSKQPKQS
ncbi:SpaA isopeptide-forming pilin-related protein [Corynebacterium sp. Q4381]|uniref:SpaA isopeptide-forming pilin-related protein n=1 Tax=Corynebacterium sp. Marseille-Q4381 TaxID=3121597 RepID=UPI002FE5644F